MKFLRPIGTIARYTVLEALRNRLAWVLAAIVLGALGLGGFLGELALTETRALQAALLSAMLRLAGVLLVATLVVTSMARETDDKGLQWLLAMPMPRAVYLFGKLAGFGALAAIPSLLFGILALTCAPPAQAAMWTISLLCELWIVAAFSLLCTLTLRHALPALATIGAFYLLARVIGTLQLLGANPLRGADAAHPLLRAALDAIAALLPRLDLYTRSEWLVYHSGTWHGMGDIGAQTAIYLSLLCAAALFDLYRKPV
ncbi:MAG: ABC transporter permease [Pseudomonadota bacterium]